MDFGTRAFRTYPSEKRPFNCQTGVSTHKPPSVIPIPLKKRKATASTECKGKEEQKNREKSMFSQSQAKEDAER